jgi:hypothetical protein
VHFFWGSVERLVHPSPSDVCVACSSRFVDEHDGSALAEDGGLAVSGSSALESSPPPSANVTAGAAPQVTYASLDTTLRRLPVHALGQDVWVAAGFTRQSRTWSKIYAPLLYSAANPEDLEASNFWGSRFSLWPAWQSKLEPVMRDAASTLRSHSFTPIFHGVSGSRACRHYTARTQEQLLDKAGIRHEVDACIQVSLAPPPQAPSAPPLPLPSAPSSIGNTAADSSEEEGEDGTCTPPPSPPPDHSPLLIPNLLFAHRRHPHGLGAIGAVACPAALSISRGASGAAFDCGG